MKVTTLIENTTCNNSLVAEHGIGLYIEFGNRTILFDSGQTGIFLQNAEKMKIVLGKVDLAILSHGHYDHGGVLNQSAFEKHFNGTKYIGLNNELQKSDRLVLIGDDYVIDDEISLSTKNGCGLLYPIDCSGLSVERDGKRIDEDFIHEQFMIIQSKGKKIVFSGCSHKGILNIMNWFKPDILIGGFHFKNIKLNIEGEEKLSKAAQELNSYNTIYYTGHCTGIDQYNFLKKFMGDKLNYIATGSQFELII